MRKVAKDDQEIKRAVVNHLVADRRVDASRITVEVSGGVVKLNGVVPSLPARSAAVAEAEEVAGVTDVVDSMRVFLPEPSLSPTDAEIKISIADTLASNPDIDPSTIAVLVLNGRVRLLGSVDVLWKKSYVEELVAVHRGVRDVKSSLTVVPTRSEDDQAVAVAISSALDRHSMIDASHVTVRVEDRCVSLFGTVPNVMARRAARSVASCISGVNVVDELNVDEREAATLPGRRLHDASRSL
jgi:osmotically-inducible protein OsmY